MRFLLIVLLVLLALLQHRLWLGEGDLPDVWHLQDELRQQRQENQGLRERNASLAAEVTDLKQGLGAIEERARSEMGMIKKSETFYQIIVPGDTDAGTPRKGRQQP